MQRVLPDPGWSAGGTGTNLALLQRRVVRHHAGWEASWGAGSVGGAVGTSANVRVRRALAVLDVIAWVSELIAWGLLVLAGAGTLALFEPAFGVLVAFMVSVALACAVWWLYRRVDWWLYQGARRFATNEPRTTPTRARVAYLPHLNPAAEHRSGWWTRSAISREAA